MAIDIDEVRLNFLRGVLAAFASSGQVVHYDEVRRLCRLSDEQMGTYLGAARQSQGPDEPDFCAIVVKNGGWPGQKFGSLQDWPAKLRNAHRYWQDRRQFDNGDFEDRYDAKPTLPGLPKERE